MGESENNPAPELPADPADAARANFEEKIRKFEHRAAVLQQFVSDEYAKIWGEMAAAVDDYRAKLNNGGRNSANSD